MRYLLAIVVGLLSFDLLAAPVPKALKAKVDYYPLALGNKWVYEGSDKDGTVFTYSYEVSRIEEVGGMRTVTMKNNHRMRQRNGESQLDYNSVIRATPKGIEQVNHENNPESHELFLTTNPEPGVSWKGTWMMGGNSFSFERRVGQPEKVAVPAGTFIAIPT